MICDLRLGRWQDVLLDVTADSLITDPPYSSTTDEGYMSAGETSVAKKKDVGYPPITFEDALELAASWQSRLRRWAVIFGDHVSAGWHREAWRQFDKDWYVFNAPVVWVKRGAPPRFQGEGPASQCEYITVARRRNLGHWGSLPGYYIVKTPRGPKKSHGGTGVTGTKDLAGMCRLVQHYSRHGDIVVDCFAGSGTTLRAARASGRNIYAAEILPKHRDIAERELARPDALDLFADDNDDDDVECGMPLRDDDAGDGRRCALPANHEGACEAA